LFVLLTIRTPWVPAEVVSLAAPVRVNPTVRTNSVSAPVVFVMNDHDDDENGWAELLIDDSRYLVWVRDKDITQRRICHLYSQLPGVDPSFDTLLFRRYHGHDLSCSEILTTPLRKPSGRLSRLGSTPSCAGEKRLAGAWYWPALGTGRRFALAGILLVLIAAGTS
jgi:hypothetical protein